MAMRRSHAAKTPMTGTIIGTLLISFLRNGVRFVANTDPHLKFTVGDNIKMYVDIGKAHFFEPGDSPINLSYTQFKIVVA